MSLTPADGERAATRGYRWQYDHIAVRVYDSILEGDLVTLRLTDPDAGRVDDLVLVRRGRVDGFQFKSAGFDSYVTFKQLLRDQRTRSGTPSPSFLRLLGDGWKQLGSRYGNVHVHLVMQQLASVGDHLGESDAADRPSPDHLSAFLLQALEPLRQDSTTIDDVAPGWRPALERLRQESDIVPDEFESFLKSVHLDFGAGPGLPSAPSRRWSDVVALSDALFRLVSTASDVVELDQRGVLDLMGWSERPRLHSRHEFPVDLDTYAPLEDAIGELKELLAHNTGGYIALVGPPGAGKSTLLSQALSGTEDRVVRYYSYVPGAAPARTRLTARGFLHDAVVMLNETGLESGERQLPSDDVHELRQQLTDVLDAAGAEFASTRHRTIVVVDGLDHVDRDHPGTDGLLAELPHPNELPDGVLFVVGTRTLTPLHAYARQQVDERHAVVDLQQHRLSPASILDVCRRASLTADLAPGVHQRIADLSSGHPLALGYLFNRLREIDPEDVDDALATAPAYEGDIAAEYRAVWEGIEDDDRIVEILAVCSRLRNGFTTEWLATWASSSAVGAFRRSLLYLFRQHHDGWRFFHDSFRQFAADSTALGDDGSADARQDALVHGRVAELCAETDDAGIAAEQLYHRYWAGQHDEVLLLAQQATFREQYRWLRSPDLIRSDVALALDLAADRTDVLAMLRLILALVEVTERRSNLESVDMPSLLYDAGLVDKAIAYCGGEVRRVPLAHAYGLAARLGRADDPAGRRIFDLIEHHGLDDPDRARVSGQEDDAAVAWTRAASLFRPLPTVLASIRSLAESRPDRERDDTYEQTERWHRYGRMMEVLIAAEALKSDEAALVTIDAALAEHAAQLSARLSQLEDDGDDAVSSKVARLIDLRVRIYTELLRLTTTADVAQSYLDQLTSVLRGVPLFHETMLRAAELLTRHGIVERASALLDHTDYWEALTVHDLSSLGDTNAVDRHFRYWKLRFFLASATEDVPQSVQPATGTPAGNDIASDAPLHRDGDAIELAARIDSAVRTLARVEAATASGDAIPVTDAWTVLLPLLDTFCPSTRRGSATLDGMAQTKPELMRLIVTVAIKYGDGLPERMSTVLANRFREQPDRWSLKLQLKLADYLRSAGFDAPWYQEALVAEEANATGQDVYSRLDDTAGLVARHARDGEGDTARRLVLALIPLALGVGYRKDYQFDSWVAWLGRALVQPDGDRFLDDAVWLARVLAAADPMTEGAPGSAAADLPAAVAPVAPAAAVRIFEYLVRHGTVRHIDALANLVRALVIIADEATVELAADITADLIAPADNRAHPDLAAAIVAAAQSVLPGESAAILVESVARRTNIHALPTTRDEWREGLGLGTETEEREDAQNTQSGVDDYGALVLVDGRRIARGDVPSHVRSIDDIISLRRQEASDSSFSWVRVIDEQTLTRDDVRTLLDVFNDGSDRSGEVLASLAAAAERAGDHDTASRLAHEALQNTPGNAWSYQYGGARLRAAATAVRLGDRDARVAVCLDLAHQVTTNRWLAGLLLYELDRVVETLDPDLGAETTWPEVRIYLDGLAETLDLPDADVFHDHGCRWWLLPSSGDRRDTSDESTPAVALAELAVGHLSHPTWLVRDVATAIVVRALTAGNEAVAAALGRFAQPGASDDTLERSGRCLAAARSHDEYVIPDVLQPLERLLACHASQVVRDLAAGPGQLDYRPLSPMYGLTLPPPAAAPIGSESVFLAPHEAQYQMLADGLDLDVDTMLTIAGRYATAALADLPEEEAVRGALKFSHMQHTYPSEKIAASRAAFGRVLADLTDAQLLDDVPQQVRRRLRTVDVELLGLAPKSQPNVVPSPPEAGHDQTLERWRSETDLRLEDYVAVSRNESSMMIGARSRLTVLNWGHLEEELVCGTTIGTDRPDEDRLLARRHSMTLRDLVGTSVNNHPEDGESLVIENVGHAFHQIHADWLAFRPDIATTLKWSPDLDYPGRWYTAAGDLAVETIWWVDGWWGRAGPAFDDTEASGHAVILTSAGLVDVAAAFGAATSHFTLERRGRDDVAEAEGVSASRSVAIVA